MREIPVGIRSKRAAGASVLAVAGLLAFAAPSADAVGPVPMAKWGAKNLDRTYVDIAYDSSRDVVLGTVAGNDATYPNELVEFDPDTGAVGRHVALGDSGPISITDSRNVAWVGGAQGSIIRVDLTTFTVTNAISTAIPNRPARPVRDVEAATGSDVALAVAIADPTGSGSLVRFYTVDGRVSGVLPGIDRLERLPTGAWGGSTFAGYSTVHGTQHTIDALPSGTLALTTWGEPVGVSSDFKTAQGYRFFESGVVWTSGSIVGGYPASGPLAIDPVLSRVTFVTGGGLKTFDAWSAQLVEERVFAGITAPTMLERTSDGFAGNTAIYGPNVGDLAAATCAGQVATIVASGGVATGTSGNDVIAGSDAADVIDGSGGDDLICAGAGDIVNGSGGADTIVGDGAAQVVYGGPGDDTIYGFADNDTIFGGPGADQLYGGGGDDQITGGEGPDRIDGGIGTDTVFLGSDSRARMVDLDDVADDGHAGEGDDVRSSNEIVVGARGSDTIIGDARSQTLRGGDGDDVLLAGGGEDACFGGAGTDIGFGCETFVQDDLKS